MVKIFSQHSSLIPLLNPIDNHYQPPQIDSIVSLLKKMRESANIFLKVHQSAKAQNKNRDCSLLLSEKIIETTLFIEK